MEYLNKTNRNNLLLQSNHQSILNSILLDKLLDYLNLEVDLQNLKPNSSYDLIQSMLKIKPKTKQETRLAGSTLKENNNPDGQ